MSAIIKQTLYDWCIENNRQDILDLWDYELNTKTPKEVGVRSSKKCWFKCPKGLHESELQYLCSFYETPTMQIYCNKCNSIAQFLIDKYGEQGFEDRWSDRNTVNPWTINKNSKTQVWINCVDNPRHTHSQYVLSVYKGVGCPYCWGRRVLPEESVGALCPDILDVWSDKNKKSPYEYSPHSRQKVWTKCLAGLHEDSFRSVTDVVKSECRCGKCSRYSSGYPEDLTGVRFGRLTVIGKDAEANDGSRWLCVCDCQQDQDNPIPKSILRGHLTSEKPYLVVVMSEKLFLVKTIGIGRVEKHPKMTRLGKAWNIDNGRMPSRNEINIHVNAVERGIKKLPYIIYFHFLIMKI